MRRDTLAKLGLALLVVLIAVSMIVYPEPSFQAAERGLGIWWDIVLPALLPFFIAAELLMELGVVHFMGVLAEPLMRPVFNVPGTGSFTFTMGVASGYPLGAALSARLKDSSLATKTEAERLMCFCNTSDPLFMTGAVAVGMFKRRDLTGVIVGAHYLSALVVGVLLRFWKRKDPPSQPIRTEPGFIVTRAYRAMRRAQRETQKAFGEALGDSVKRSVNTLLTILGFMVLFSVVFELMKTAGVASALSRGLSAILPGTILPPALHDSLVSGLFELTIGTASAASAEAPLVAKVAMCSAIIAWSGLSVHAQVAAVIQPSGMSVLPYSMARLIQALLAAFLTVQFMKPGAEKWSLPTFEPHVVTGSLAWFHTLGTAAKTCLACVSAVAAVSLVMALVEVARKACRRV
ncbi:MAG: sporulation integral membrane protein YlbJ [Bacillota bacterium]